MCIDEVKGRVLSVHSTVGQYLPDWRPGQDYKKGVSAQAKLGGGALLELSHEIDYILWVFGDIQWVRATLATKSELELDVEDSAHLTLGIEQKSSKNNLIATLNVDFIRRDPIRECQVVCEFGTIKWDGLDNQISIYDSSRKKWNIVYTGKVSMVQTYEEQLTVIGKDLLVTKEETKTEIEGLRVLEVIEASRKSAPTGLQTPVIKNVIG
jgi:predicted dehydrogenase